jgi:raffinose/stachyose/melibiose transport system permease protein
VKKLERAFGNKLAIAIFISPALILFTLVIPLPILHSFYMSLFKWDMLSTMTYVGFENYKDLFSDGIFLSSIWHTIEITVLSLIFQVILGLFLALCIVNITKGRKYFQNAFFIPNILSSAVIGILWFFVYNYDFGLINSILKSIGLDSLQQEWLSQKYVILALSITTCWQWVGYHMILYIAAISGISQDIIEAAIVDGAQGLKMVTKIIIPQIRPVLRVSIVLIITGSLKYFDMAWIMTEGGPDFASETIATYIYRTAFNKLQYGLGSAASTFLFAVSILITVLINKLAAKREEVY